MVEPHVVETVVAQPLHILSKRRMISVLVVAMSCGLTAAMSLLFHREIRPDMMATGFVAAVIINFVVGRLTRVYRQRLRQAHEALEGRVRDRTADLQRANEELRKALEEQRTLRDELMVRDRMATAGMVAAGVSHEIRSPLSVIVLLLEELRHQIGEHGPHAQRELVVELKGAAEHITTIVRDLASIARPIDDPLGPIDLPEVIDIAARLAAHKFGKGVSLERGSIDVPPVLGNSSRLIQLLMNLLVNAARATRPDAPNTLRVDATVDGTHVLLTIADTGTGMSPETRTRVFEPFFTTGRDTGGTGLGLVICRSIVERMGGEIDIASELGVGTTVTVRLQPA